MLNWLTLITVAGLPAYGLRFNLMGLPMTALEVLILITFAVWFFTAKQKKFPLWWLVIAWLLISFAGVIVSGWSVPAFGIWKAYFLEPALLYVVIVNVIDTKEKAMRLLTAFAVPAVILSIIAIYQYITGDFISNPMWASAAGRRATSLFSYPNAVGLYLGPVLLLMVGAAGMMWSQGRRQWAMIYSAAAILSLGGILAARSDGALFAVVIALGLFGLIANKLLRRIAVIAALAGCLVLVTVPKLQTYIIERARLEDFSGQVRRIQWKETLKMLMDGRRITGAGIAQYQTAVKPYHQEGFFYNADNDPEFLQKVQRDENYRASHWQPLEIYLYPHNIILNFWSEIGLFGLLAFLVIIIYIMVIGFKNFHEFHKEHSSLSYAALGLTLSFVVMLIHGIVDVPYFKNDLAAMFWVIAAMTICHKQLFKNS